MIASFVLPTTFEKLPCLYLAKKPATTGITKSNNIAAIPTNIITIICNAVLNDANQPFECTMHNTINYISMTPSINASIAAILLILLKLYSASGINTLLSLFIMSDPPCIAMILCKSKSLLFFIFFITLLHK